MFRTITVLGGVLALSLVGAAESFGVPSDPPTVDVNVVNMEADAVPVVVQNAVDVMSQSVQPVTSGDDVFNDVKLRPTDRYLYRARWEIEPVR